jgi:hypothetical protein
MNDHDLNEEAGFDPVLCTPDELRRAILRTSSIAAMRGGKERQKLKTRTAFLLGVEHARIVIAAATGGRIS